VSFVECRPEVPERLQKESELVEFFLRLEWEPYGSGKQEQGMLLIEDLDNSLGY
jgi:hypothetical protein